MVIRKANGKDIENPVKIRLAYPLYQRAGFIETKSEHVVAMKYSL